MCNEKCNHPEIVTKALFKYNQMHLYPETLCGQFNVYLSTLTLLICIIDLSGNYVTTFSRTMVREAERPSSTHAYKKNFGF